MAVDIRPAVGRGFSLIVEAGPHKAAGDKGPGRDRLPSAFRRIAPARRVVVVRADIRLHGIVGIYPPIAELAAGFAAVDRHFWELLVERIVLRREIVDPL